MSQISTIFKTMYLVSTKPKDISSDQENGNRNGNGISEGLKAIEYKPSDQDSGNMLENIAGPSVFSCPFCEEKYEKNKDLQNHINLSHISKPIMHNCNKCNYKTQFLNEYQAHYEEQHRGEKRKQYDYDSDSDGDQPRLKQISYSPPDDNQPGLKQISNSPPDQRKKNYKYDYCDECYANENGKKNGRNNDNLDENDQEWENLVVPQTKPRFPIYRKYPVSRISDYQKSTKRKQDTSNIEYPTKKQDDHPIILIILEAYLLITINHYHWEIIS